MYVNKYESTTHDDLLKSFNWWEMVMREVDTMEVSMVEKSIPTRRLCVPHQLVILHA
jgi:hypothetical protein